MIEKKKQYILDKKTSLEKAAEKEITKKPTVINVGDTYIDEDGRIFKILKVTKIKIVTTARYGNSEEDTDTYKNEEREMFPYSLHREPFIKLEKSKEEYLKDGIQLLQTGIEEEKEEISEETAITKGLSKEAVEGLKNELEYKTNQFEIMHRILDAKLSILHNSVNALKEQTKRICKVISVIELYLGIHEEVFQLQQGEIAKPEEPLCIRQMVLYMDEETGITQDQGIDFTSIDKFDDWLLEGNIDKILPEKKGIVALRIRRYYKEYHDPFYNAECNKENMRTYLLIRNGDNLYRIWAPIKIEPRLFPLKNEFKRNEDDTSFRRFFNERDEENAKFDYKKHALAIQGILDRTQILQPLPPGISVFKPNTWGNSIKFIADEEAALPDGRLRWKEWQKEINSKIAIGSRIYYVHNHLGDKIKGRVPHGYQYSYWPSHSVYKVTGELKRREDKNFTFLYNPGGDVFSENYKNGSYCHERKNRISFSFWLDEVLNYDQISLEDIEFYLNSRIDRPNYLDMLPILKEMKKTRLAELEREKHFVTLVASRTGKSEEQVWKAIDWWKYKNIWKRPVEEDDAKALRMITKHLRTM